MTIQEAIKSGKPFRRKGTQEFYIVDYNTGFICVYDTTHSNSGEFSVDLYVDDLLADDWMLCGDGE